MTKKPGTELTGGSIQKDELGGSLGAFIFEFGVARKHVQLLLQRNCIWALGLGVERLEFVLHEHHTTIDGEMAGLGWVDWACIVRATCCRRMCF